MADFREIQGKASRAGIVLGLVLILFIIGISKMSIVINAGEAGVLFKTLGGGVETEKNLWRRLSHNCTLEQDDSI
jgi:hypothetical protein